VAKERARATKPFLACVTNCTFSVHETVLPVNNINFGCPANKEKNSLVREVV